MMTWKMCQELKKFGVGPKEIGALRLNDIDFYNKLELNNSVVTEKPIYSVYRSKLDEALANRLRTMGYASFYEGAELQELNPKTKRAVIEQKEHSFTHLILCTNFNKIVHQLYGWRPTGYGVQGDFTPQKPEDKTKIFFNILGGGFAWALPKADGNITVGIAQKEDSSVNFISRLMMIAYEYGYSVPQQSIRVGYTPYGDALSSVPNLNGVWAAGTALGLTDPVIGEGMYYAALSGYQIGNLIAKYGEDTNAITADYNKFLSGISSRMQDSMKLAKMFQEPNNKQRNTALKYARGHDGFVGYCIDNIVNEYNIPIGNLAGVAAGYLVKKVTTK
jgi:flavin-dependent dehydrogenase